MNEIQSYFASGATLIAEYGTRLLDSAFSIALVGALAGAYAGAVAAHRSIDRARRRNESLQEIRSTNAAIVIGLSICNTALALKRQLVQPMVEEFTSARAEFQQLLAQHASGASQGALQYHLKADLITFPSPRLPLDTLKELVYGRLNAQGKVVALVAQVEGAAAGLTGSIASLDRLIEQFKNSDIPPDRFAFIYFGEKLGSGHTHREYADTIEAIRSYVNDVIWFSSTLCIELARHGQAHSATFKKRFGKGAPVVSKPDFSAVKESGLHPPDSDYSSWSNWIVEKRSCE